MFEFEKCIEKHADRYQLLTNEKNKEVVGIRYVEVLHCGKIERT
jgi:hypothetical protein